MNQAAPTTSAATYTISGKPRMRLSSSARNTSSLTRTMSPPVSSTDRPTPTKPMARLAMRSEVMNKGKAQDALEQQGAEQVVVDPHVVAAGQQHRQAHADEADGQASH